MKRVFIVSKHPLFGKGVESLLAQRGCVAIVGLEQDGETALRCVQELRADVVIVDCDSRDTAVCALITRMLALAPPVKVLGVGLHDNTLYIFRREEKTVATVEDLLDAIES
jgi:DNA-binding NarL/FixJ family response regulator